MPPDSQRASRATGLAFAFATLDAGQVMNLVRGTWREPGLPRRSN